MVYRKVFDLSGGNDISKKLQPTITPCSAVALFLFVYLVFVNRTYHTFMKGYSNI